MRALRGALFVALVTIATTALAAPPAACPDTRYVVLAGRVVLTGGASDVPPAVVVTGAHFAIQDGCAVKATRVRTTRRGRTVVGRIPRCGALRRLVLRARLSADCLSMHGTIQIPGLGASDFDAAQSVCGDGVVDVSGGEGCDLNDRPCAPPLTCTVDCRCVSPEEVTSTTTTTTSTTIPTTVVVSTSTTAPATTTTHAATTSTATSPGTTSTAVTTSTTTTTAFGGSTTTTTFPAIPIVSATISAAPCTAGACACGPLTGRRYHLAATGLATGTVGTYLFVNVDAAAGGVLQCGSWSPAPVGSHPSCTGAIGCCRREEGQPDLTEWAVADVRTPGCTCPGSPAPSHHWLAGAQKVPAGQFVSQELDSAACPP